MPLQERLEKIEATQKKLLEEVKALRKAFDDAGTEIPPGAEAVFLRIEGLQAETDKVNPDAPTPPEA